MVCLQSRERERERDVSTKWGKIVELEVSVLKLFSLSWSECTTMLETKNAVSHIQELMYGVYKT